MPELVLLRHGQSLWNQKGRFTGWDDIDLSAKGIDEARIAGRLLSAYGYTFDIAYTSFLKRAIRTLWIVLDEMDLMYIPAIPSWRLNERSYGALQGRSKRDAEKEFGAELVHRWRRGYYEKPPAMEVSDKRYLASDPRYRMLVDNEIPRTESLKDTLDRVLPFWQEKIAPDLADDKRVFVCAHGNTIRALVKHIDGISDQAIEDLEVPTGVPLIYRLDGSLNTVARFYINNLDRCKEKPERRTPPNLL
jgi:2,3-bisphosphoglycerate-dependent phosphoglycerate mutase